MQILILAFVACSSARLFCQTSEAALRSGFEQAEKALADGKLKEAEAAYLKLTKLAPNVAEFHGRLGLVYFEEHRFEEAVPPSAKPSNLSQACRIPISFSPCRFRKLANTRKRCPGLKKGIATVPTLS